MYDKAIVSDFAPSFNPSESLILHSNGLPLPGQLWANMMSSTKPKVHNVLYHQRRTKPCQQLACTENFVKSGNVISEMCKWTDIQTSSWQTDNTSHTCRGRSKK